MKIQFIKNLQFTRLVKADGRLREFNFRKINGDQECLFTVDVSDDRGNRKIFRLSKQDNSWKTIAEEELPEWITKNTPVLQNLIEEELKQPS